ncbi:hypothetical protein FZEAL_3763 [Fusarium zealandicum]|uniref:Uncharacterized protein n=1 Tax=Fusarium zealandicum TaxID=1053134 RepID=A0A8H4UNW0_9HYPO|nr:hypothetical protein FZEAL_3763 [Fusarium zealandicum]
METPLKDPKLPSMVSGALVPLKPKQKRRLYEPLVLYKALTEIAQARGLLRRPQLPEKPSTEEQRFHRFVHRLANVCDNTKGGKTVTSFAVLDHETKFVYVFACNQVCEPVLASMHAFICRLLAKLCGFDLLESDSQLAVKDELLSMILGFNRPRLDVYLRDFKTQLGNCLEYCQRETSSKDLISYNRLLDALAVFLTPKNKRYIDDRALKGRIRDGKSYECWSELRHVLTRLRIYGQVVQNLIDAEREWPEIFQEVEVIQLSSSKAESNPLGKKSETAHAIIGRMGAEEHKKERYHGFAQELQGMQLDDRIRKKCSAPSFKPFVHSEILVLEWVMANSSRLGLRFFHDFKYIGSSKGACKLCYNYFDTPGQHGGIRTRPSHGNLYIKWRFPDLFEADGAQGRARRQEIYNHMTKRIRDDAFEAMENKDFTGKRHDSSTHPLMSVRQTDVQTDLGAPEMFDMDDLGEQLETGLSLGGSTTPDSLEDSDDEEGGISLT